MRIRITRSAEADLMNGYAFYEHQQAGVGAYFLDSLYADIDALMLYGGVHAKPIAGLHRAMAKRFPFAIYYDRQGDLITVVAVLDCRRNPDSIVKRLSRQ